MKKASPKISRKVVERYRVDGGKKFRLDDYDPADTAGLAIEGPVAKEMLREGVEMLAELGVVLLLVGIPVYIGMRWWEPGARPGDRRRGAQLRDRDDRRGRGGGGDGRPAPRAGRALRAGLPLRAPGAARPEAAGSAGCAG